MNLNPWMPYYSEDRGVVLKSWIVESVGHEPLPGERRTSERVGCEGESLVSVVLSQLGDRCLRRAGSLLISVGTWLLEREGGRVPVIRPI
jgi:hypothetical protein